MSYTANIEGFEGQNIEVSMGFWSGSKLLVNGEPAPKGSKRGEMILQRNDGKQVTAGWKPQVLGLDVPQLMVDGKPVPLVEPLKWQQWVWGGWPVVLIFMGGALGGLAGIFGFAINAKIFRTELNEFLKYVVTSLVSVMVVVAYFVAAVIFSILINR